MFARKTKAQFWSLFYLPICLGIAVPCSAKAEQGTNCRTLINDPNANLDSALAAGCDLTAEQVSRLMDNPVGEIFSLPIQYEQKRIKESVFGSSHTIQTMKLIPTFPVRLGNRWSLVNRLVLSFPRIPINTGALADFQFESGGLGGSLTGSPRDASAFTGSTSGFGDMAYVGLFTPRDARPTGTGRLIWALGPTFIFPTASKDILGQGKYQAGLAGAVAYLGSKWTLGLFPQHWWSVAGDSERPETSRTNIQYFVFRKLANQWSIGASPVISVNWKARGGTKIDLPIGLGVNKTVFIGRLPVRFSLEAQVYADRSDDITPKWGMKFSITPAVPAAFLRHRS